MWYGCQFPYLSTLKRHTEDIYTEIDHSGAVMKIDPWYISANWRKFGLQVQDALNRMEPVSFRVIIDPPHPLVCRKRRLNGAVLWMRPGKTETPCHICCDTTKIPPCLKVQNSEHRHKFCSPSSVMVTSPYKWKNIEQDV
jgi:hypothetical protein